MRSLVSPSRFLALCIGFLIAGNANAAALMAGAAKVDITDERGPVNDRLYARALVLKSGDTTAVLVTLDAVAIGEIGRIKDDFLPAVRAVLKKELGIPPAHTIFNASHCHGLVHPDVEARTVQAVKAAVKNLVPVKAGAGVGRETRIMENRRLVLKSGKVVDVRHAYSLPPDELVAAVGPVDTEIGVLRLDRLDGKPLAIVYNFACHPIQGVPSGANTADITGFASQVIEDNLTPGAVALFVQGCGGDINPIAYKDIEHPRHAEPLGNRLGLSTLKGIREIKTKADNRLALFNETIELPRANLADRISQLEQQQLVVVYVAH